MEEMQSNLCKMCYKEIDSRAKKCPYCHHWQSKFFMVVYHPAFSVAVVLMCFVLPWLMFIKTFAKMSDKGEDFTLYREQISIGETELKFGEGKCGRPSVIVMGDMINNSDVPWEEVQIEVQFYNRDNQLIDTEQKNKYFFVVPANDVSKFKVSIPREFPEEQYFSVKARILSAKDARTWW